MEIVVMRHGIAADIESFQGPDSQRPLTDRGRERTAKVVRAIQERGIDVTLIAASPLVRAQQTAEIVADVYPHAGRVTWQPLAAGASAPDILGCLQDVHERDSVMIVGHEPDLQLFVGYMLGVTNLYGIPLKKAGIAWLEGRLQPGQCELRAVLTPRLLLGNGMIDD